jgi:Right handed beta helix region
MAPDSQAGNDENAHTQISMAGSIPAKPGGPKPFFVLLYHIPIAIFCLKNFITQSERQTVMKTHLTILLFVLISAGSLWGAEYTATPATFHNIQRDANSGDTIIMEPNIYHGEWCDGPDGKQFWTPVIDPNGRNIVYKKDPNFSGEVILSGLVPPIPTDSFYYFRPPCQIKNGEGSGCQVIDLTMRCGLAPEEYPSDFCDNYPWMGIECRNSSPLIQDCNLIDFPSPPSDYRGCKIGITNTNGRLVIQSCRFTDANNGDSNDGGISIAVGDGDDVVDVQINNCILSCINNVQYFGISAGYTTLNSIVEINNCDISNFGQGGISVGSAETTISDCNIINNHGSDGGGILCGGNSVVVRRCNLIGNTADGTGGGIYNLSSSIILEDCNIIGNTAGGLSGGGIYSDSYNLTLKRCRIENNTAYGDGGGIGGYSYIDANHCIIRENEAVGYGGGIQASDLNLVNCVISKNRSGVDGGGIYILNDSYLYNCTISENEANGSGGGAYFGYGPINATNCIFWGNADTEGYPRYHQIYSWSPDSVYLRNCDIQNTSVIGSYVFDDNIVYPDANIIGRNLGGNIDANPLFADDYHLGGSSPCINAGYNNVVYWAYDIDGDNRILDGIVDIGADEEHYCLIPADYNKDGIVNFVDFAFLGSAWRTQNPNISLDGNNDVDINDLKIFCDSWLRYCN